MSEVLDWGGHLFMHADAHSKERFQFIVNAMTNHERNLWARAGYPGLQKSEIEKLKPFAQAANRRRTGKIISLREAISTGEVHAR